LLISASCYIDLNGLTEKTVETDIAVHWMEEIGEIMNRILIALPKQQAGVSKFGLLLVFLMIAVFLTVGLKVAPAYVDHNLISGIAEELVENGDAAQLSQRDLRQQIANSLRINNIYGFEMSNIKMEKIDGVPVVSIAYESRIPLFANLDVVAVFDTTIQPQ